MFQLLSVDVHCCLSSPGSLLICRQGPVCVHIAMEGTDSRQQVGWGTLTCRHERIWPVQDACSGSGGVSQLESGGAEVSAFLSESWEEGCSVEFPREAAEGRICSEPGERA